VTYCWQLLTKTFHLIPDEGICILVMNAAIRHKRPDMAYDVLTCLQASGLPLREHHYAAVIAAFAESDQLMEAYAMVEDMKRAGIEPSPGTFAPILSQLASSESIDDNWTLLDDIFRETGQMDVALVNLNLKASAIQGDFESATRGVNKFSDYGIAPTTETMNILLDALLTAKARVDEATGIIRQMAAAKVRPDRRTYLKMVALCLVRDGSIDERTFFYLEEMKAAGHLPPQGLYESVIEKCAEQGDDRYALALEEMKEIGYPCTSTYETMVHNKYQRYAPTRVQFGDGTGSNIELDSQSRAYIRTGGLEGSP
jgi:pentatricopeptide repeat protein